MYKKPRPLAAGGSESEEEIEFTRHKSAGTPSAVKCNSVYEENEGGHIFWECLHSDNVEELVNILQAEPRHLETQLAAISPVHL